MNPWTHTSRGRALDLIDPHLDDVDLVEVGMALGRQCRYNGCTTRYYSVAEHSVLISRALERDGHPPLVQLAGLLHDAAEAYTGDITWPVQQVLWGASVGARAAYEAMRRRLDELICQHAHAARWDELADLLHRDPVRTYDLRILLDERDHVLTGRPRPWAVEEQGLTPLGVVIEGWAPESRVVSVYYGSWGASAGERWLGRLGDLQYRLRGTEVLP